MFLRKILNFFTILSIYNWIQISPVFAIISVNNTIINNQKFSKNYKYQVITQIKKVKLLEEAGDFYLDIGNFTKALLSFEEALYLYQDLDDYRGEGRILNSLGVTYRNLGELEKALESYSAALKIFETLEDLFSQSQILSNMATVYEMIGDRKLALATYKKSLKIIRSFETKNARCTESTTLNNIGWLYYQTGEPKLAITNYEEALEVAYSNCHISEHTKIINNLGVAYELTGELQKALNLYNQSLELSKQNHNKSAEAIILSNIGQLYQRIGNMKSALDFYNQALLIHKEVQQPLAQSSTINNIGVLYLEQKQFQQALHQFLKASELSEGVPDFSETTNFLNNIGAAYQGLANFPDALKYYDRSRSLSKQIGDLNGEAVTLNNMGVVYSDMGQLEKAVDYLTKALSIFQKTGDSGSEAHTLGNIASLEQYRGNLIAALTNIQKSIEILETTRREISDSDLRTSYFASVNDYYQFYIDILMELHQQNLNDGYNKQALGVSEQARARTLLELIEEGAIYRGIAPQLKAQKEELDRQIAAKTQAIKSLKGSQQNQIATLKQERKQLETQLKNLQATIRQQNPEYAQLTQVQLHLNAQEIQQKIVDENSVLLSYWLGKDQSYLWLVTPNSITSYTLPSQAEIEQATQELLSYAQDGGEWDLTFKKANAANQRLSQMLLAPIADKIVNKRLIIIADGALQYLPFSLLENPQTNQSLITNHEIVNLPSASTLDTIRKSQKTQPNSKEVAIFAHPVFTQDDSRLQGKVKSTSANQTLETSNLLIKQEAIKGFNFRPLPGTETTAQQILTYVNDNNQTTLKLGFAANRKAIFDPSINQYRLIHLGTHGFFNKEKPEYSGIVLSLYDKEGNYQSDGLLLLTEVFNLDLPADLVVLSACNTVGGKEVKGEGIVGLTRGLMYAGAARVIVTLWDVDDKATAVFMSRFYEEILENKLTPAVALRKTQLWMQQESEYPTPDYWAAFVLQGEWN